MNKRLGIIRNHSAEANLFARRTFISGLAIIAMILAILGNLYFLQVKRYDDYQTRANGNRIKIMPVAPNRGLIYDRNGVLLADNRPVFSLEIIPEQVQDLDRTLIELEKLLGFDRERSEDFKQRLKHQRRFKPVPLKQNLSEEEVAKFTAIQHRFSGAFIEARPGRYYPYKDALTHVLGYVARINKSDLQKLENQGLEEDYAATHDIGKQGVEKFHEQLLHGSVGYQEVEVNNQGRIIRTLDFSAPTAGQDLILNLDIHLQLKAKEILEDRRGAVVVLDAKDGGVLTLYSNPSYDPNLFVNGISSKNYNRLLNSLDRPLINRATQGRYPPASTVKPLIGLLGLEQGIIDIKSRHFDNGKYKLAKSDHVWRDWWRQGHGWVNVVKAIEVSCDTFFYDLALKLGIDKISDAMYQFGFGDFTGIDLHEETDANMPSRGWKRARYNEPWYVGDTVIIGIGQGAWTATPLQIAQSISILVNRGKKLRPQILRGQQFKEQQIFKGAEEMPSINIKNQENINIVMDAMYGTVNRQHGGARRAFLNTEYISAGKTGTAQLVQIAQGEKYDEDKVKERHRDNAMYVGYAPYDDPQIVVAVVLENAGGGGKNAAPVARQMMDAYFARQQPAQLVEQTRKSATTSPIERQEEHGSR